ncbi:Aconitate hydratase @ 2-methylisocitrate dehydratase [Burkholderia pseudomallei]|uniref:aconitate hydratase AcnA n=1 Tax=Burkholderia pseudomallei TaxID=28450 RepID=UPI000F07C067|nr:aconitate hydratase AcnA [Burkholderia pseudomallei]CAJ2941823.1 Aconitate hydratase @ 2-methylisocitrate dehydratase [Burkholderia pseudomallei]CAJ5981781.1 Aconitate hydratase @ 2-methylisocitrate dehydratase [Burkholderia pseudomallei]VCG54068.1 Aconitate hydratase @ 2-methylisocitrate dehydratase [Burkholderia pseudomallei]VCG76771.1 Aconitate hydratase @ 2-methylisocitrate dehydratase [Burkholderia pseudomallei]VCG78197.1 Aconitate hydratase @ 2-methylisocitrate dehydratase [Burkholder
MAHNLHKTLKEFDSGSGKGKFYSLPKLGKELKTKIERLPVSIRIVLESVLRNYDGKKITEEHIEQLANWKPNAKRVDEIPFVVSRVVLQDFTGVPLLADIAAMRGVAKRAGKNPKKIEPLVPVDLVVDHSVQIDYFRQKDALDLNMKLEFQRNNERYQFMKWGMQAFDTFKVVPPGVGIVHQVNLEYLARGVHKKKDDGDTVYYPDTLVGTDSHTTMINGIGVVGWGVGGIEAEAGMLGQPVYFLTPDVVGVELKGKLREGVTATDLVLTITEMLRKEKVVGKFVEFFGEGTKTLALPDRATIANMAPEYGATMGFFPVDEKTIDYFKGTGRTKAEIAAFENYFKAQELFGIPKAGEIDYTKTLTLDLSTVAPSLAGPKRPQDRIEIGNVKSTFTDLFSKPVAENGFAKKADDLTAEYRTSNGVAVKNGDVLIAAITSCTNTSNPSVLLAAGLLAKKAVEAGLTVAPHIKTSLAPGSRIVTEYLTKTGLLPYLAKLGFEVAAYGCTTCIGNAGDLTPELNEAITKNDIVAAAVLSGNRNFEARIHPNIRANFLASPPLVVAYAIAGNITKDLMTEPVGQGKGGRDVYLGDIWPSSDEVQALLKFALDPEKFEKNYSHLTKKGDLWSKIEGESGQIYDWPKSTYIAEPPFFGSDFSMEPAASIATVKGARALGIFGDSVTTDHISPAGSIKEDSPAGKWLKANGVQKADFNSYGSRRGNHDVMMRGTFANVRIKNLMIPAKADGTRVEGGLTIHQPSGEQLSIYDAAMKYIDADTPTVVFAGEEYGTGSSRDWAAKGTQLLGVKAVIARSFERIHRSNLVGMGVLPLQFKGSDSIQSLGITGDETYDIEGLGDDFKPQQDVTLVIHRRNGETKRVPVLLRIDTPIEVDYYKHGGILPFVLRSLLAA